MTSKTRTILIDDMQLRVCDSNSYCVLAMGQSGDSTWLSVSIL